MIKINFINSDFKCKDGKHINVCEICITNTNGNYLKYLDFNFKLPQGIESYEEEYKVEDITRDQYGRYCLGDYIVSNKYSMSLNILLKGEND